MYARVKFNDNSVGVYHTKNVNIIEDNLCIVKHRGSNYEAILLATGDNKHHLHELTPSECAGDYSLDLEISETSIGNSLLDSSLPSCSKNRISYTEGHNDYLLQQASRSETTEGAGEDIFFCNLQNLEEPQNEPIKIANVTMPKISEVNKNEKVNIPSTNHDTEIEQEVFSMNGKQNICKKTLSINIEDFSFGPEMIEINSSNSILANSFPSFVEDDIIQHDKQPTEDLLNDSRAECVENTECEALFSKAVENDIFKISNTENRIGNKNAIDENCSMDISEFEDDSFDDPSYKPSEKEEEEAERETLKLICNNQLTTTNKSINYSQTIQNMSTSPELAGPSCDDTNMYVTQSRGKKGDRKHNFCYYCKTKQQKLARHLETQHKTEEEVKKFLLLPKGNLERRTIIGHIRKKGNFLFNTNEHLNDGELIVSRRPQQKFSKSARDFKACANCKGFFSKNALRYHFRQCTGKVSQHKRLPMVLSKKITARLHPIASDVVKKYLFPPLREDDIVRLVRYDELIILYSNKMVEKYKNPRHFDMIRQKIRLLGRVLMTIRELNKDVSDLASVYDPKYCDDTLQAINKVSKYNISSFSYETPTVAFHAGTLLKQIGAIFINHCIKNHFPEKRKNAKDFIKLLTEEININVNRAVTESQIQIRRRNPTILPTIDDIKKLHQYISSKRNISFSHLQKEFSTEFWNIILETSLLSIMIFNRRRPGEVERIQIEDFRKYHQLEDTDNDLFKSLSSQNKNIANKYVRFVIRGKLNRTVPVLIDINLLNCLNLILTLRTDAGVSNSNPYIFGVPGINTNDPKYLKACNVMRKYSVDCGAEYPERLRGTKLRKHMATTCITLNLEDQDISDVANFMGHHEKIHRDIYRQPVASREILKMSKILEMAQGNISECDDDSDDDLDEIETVTANTTPLIRTASSSRKRNTPPYGSVKRTKWLEEEKRAVLSIFKKNIEKKTLPSLMDIQKVIRETPVLCNRTSPQIKTWIHNQFKSKRKLAFLD